MATRGVVVILLKEGYKTMTITNAMNDFLYQKRFITELSRRKFQFFDHETKKWKSFFPNKMPDVKGNEITIRLKTIPSQSMTLTFPFQLTESLAYLFGICMGSALWSKQFLIKVQRSELERIQDVAKAINIPLEIIPHERGRKTYKKERHRRYFREYVVKFPQILLQLFNSIAGTKEDFYRTPKIPCHLPPKMQKAIFSGYFNSKRTSILFKHDCTIHGKCTITVKGSKYANQHDPVPIFLLQIQDFLTRHEIKSFLTKYEHDSKETITCRLHVYSSEILKLQRVFNIQKTKFLAFAALNEHFLKDKTIRRFISELQFSELHLILLGYSAHLTFKENVGSFAYTRFEEVFDYSSSVIRSALYQLQDHGFIVGFMNERRKEFYRLSDKYLIKARTRKEEHQKKHLDDVKCQQFALMFECQSCFQIIDFLNALTDAKTFECPHCHGTTLSPLSNEKEARVFT
ncbi:MAG: hypothetical protein ACXQS8_04055 [Candidatus Helarchaeales archaeon]